MARDIGEQSRREFLKLAGLAAAAGKIRRLTRTDAGNSAERPESAQAIA
jgi:hypothetical protein